MTIETIIIAILAILAGLGKAVRDTIAHHWGKCIFSKIKNELWFKWFRSDWRDKPNHPIWFLWDAWHCFDSLSYVVYLPILFLFDGWFHLVVIVIFRWLAFHDFYHKILLITEDKDNG